MVTFEKFRATKTIFVYTAYPYRTKIIVNGVTKWTNENFLYHLRNVHVFDALAQARCRATLSFRKIGWWGFWLDTIPSEKRRSSQTDGYTWQAMFNGNSVEHKYERMLFHLWQGMRIIA